jgi:hypothetical protein
LTKPVTRLRTAFDQQASRSRASCVAGWPGWREHGVIDPATADAAMGMARMANLALTRPEQQNENAIEKRLVLTDTTLLA